MGHEGFDLFPRIHRIQHGKVIAFFAAQHDRCPTLFHGKNSFGLPGRFLFRAPRLGQHGGNILLIGLPCAGLGLLFQLVFAQNRPRRHDAGGIAQRIGHAVRRIIDEYGRAGHFPHLEQGLGQLVRRSGLPHGSQHVLQMLPRRRVAPFHVDSAAIQISDFLLRRPLRV